MASSRPVIAEVETIGAERGVILFSATPGSGGGDQLNVAKCQEKPPANVYLRGMRLHIKLLSLPESGDHVIVIARGPLNIESLELVFTKLEASTSRLQNCKILIDVSEAFCSFSPLGIHDFVNVTAADIRLPATKIALVSAAENHQYDEIFMLYAFLSNRGFPVSLFRDTREAVQWLAAKEDSKPIR
jgi:hypothetical protein